MKVAVKQAKNREKLYDDSKGADNNVKTNDNLVFSFTT